MNNINIKNHYQNIFLFLVPFIALILFIPLSYGELNMSDSGSVVTYGLLLPEYKVDISQYNDTKEILVDVKFQNKKKSFTGISDNWLTVEEGQTPQQVYDDFGIQRWLVVYIDNITNSEKYIIKQDDMDISSDVSFLQLIGSGSQGKNAFEIEVLNIDDLIDLSTNFNDALEFQLKIKSDKFFPENKYELLIGTWTRNAGLTESAKFTFPSDLTNTREQKEDTVSKPQQPTPKPKQQEDRSENNVSNLQQQQLEQQQRAIAEAEQRKQQRELEKIELEKLQEENKKLEIMSGNTKQEMPDDNLNVVEETKEKPEYIPEPTGNTRPAEENRCGAGTVMIDGICIVEQKLNTQPEEKGFVEWLMSLFGM